MGFEAVQRGGRGRSPDRGGRGSWGGGGGGTPWRGGNKGGGFDSPGRGRGRGGFDSRGRGRGGSPWRGGGGRGGGDFHRGGRGGGSPWRGGRGGFSRGGDRGGPRGRGGNRPSFNGAGSGKKQKFADNEEDESDNEEEANEKSKQKKGKENKQKLSAKTLIAGDSDEDMESEEGSEESDEDLEEDSGEEENVPAKKSGNIKQNGAVKPKPQKNGFPLPVDDEEDSEDEDEEESDEDLEEDSDDEENAPAKKSGNIKQNGAVKPKPQKNGLPLPVDDLEDEEDSEDEDEDDESEESAAEMPHPSLKNKAPPTSKKGIFKNGHKGIETKEEEDSSSDGEELESEEDEEVSDEDEKPKSMSNASGKQNGERGEALDMGYDSDEDDEESDEEDEEDSEEDEDEPQTKTTSTSKEGKLKSDLKTQTSNGTSVSAKKSLSGTPADTTRTPKEKKKPVSLDKQATPKAAKKAPVIRPMEEDSDNNSDSSRGIGDSPVPTSKKNRLQVNSEQQAVVGKKRKATESAEMNGGSIKKPKQLPQTVIVSTDVATEEKNRMKIRDCQCLFVKNLARTKALAKIYALSPDILSVRKWSAGGRVAWLQFASEEIAEKNLVTLRQTKLEGKSFQVDYVGLKSKSYNPEQEITKREINPLELFVSGLPQNPTLAEVKAVFPTSTAVRYPPSKAGARTFSFVSFKSPQDARSAFDKTGNAKIRGSPLCVIFASLPRVKEQKAPTVKKNVSKIKGGTAIHNGDVKKQIVGKKPVQDSSDDDDDDEDEESDE